jgi:hypothetical protein
LHRRFFSREDGRVQLRCLCVELGEIGGVLAMGPGVRSVAVVLQAGDTPNAALVAYVAPEDADQGALLEACTAKVLKHMVPSAGCGAGVRLAELPRLPTCKVRLLSHLYVRPPADKPDVIGYFCAIQ